MQLKGKQAERFAKKPDPSIWCAVAFGEDEGTVADAARALVKAWTPKGAGLEVITLDEDTVRKDNAALFDALEAVSLLGDERVIRLRTNGDKLAKLLVEIIKTGDEAPGRFAAKMIVQCGPLKPKSKIRAAAEKAKFTVALQLFADEIGDVSGLVESGLMAEGAAIEPDALAAFAAGLPGHRSIARSEIEKLSLYARGLGRAVNMDDVRALSATDVDHALHDAVNAALGGRVDQAQAALDKLSIAGTSGISVLRALERETGRMLQAHAAMAEGSSDPGMKLRPPVFRSQWPAFRAKLQKWPPRRLARIMERLYDAELQAKSASQSADPIVRVLLRDIARVAEATRATP